jgi:hypothetical protein
LGASSYVLEGKIFGNQGTPTVGAKSNLSRHQTSRAGQKLLAMCLEMV